jgi:hypothetical protein
VLGRLEEGGPLEPRNLRSAWGTQQTNVSKIISLFFISQEMPVSHFWPIVFDDLEFTMYNAV